MNRKIQFETHIQGIPCQVRAMWCEGHRGYCEPGGQQIDPDEPDGFEDIEILDRNGRPAPWLEKKMTDADYDRIVEAGFKWMEDQR